MEISGGKVRAILMGFYFIFSGEEAAGMEVTITLTMRAMENWVVAIVLSVDILTSLS